MFLSRRALRDCFTMRRMMLLSATAIVGSIASLPGSNPAKAQSAPPEAPAQAQPLPPVNVTSRRPKQRRRVVSGQPARQVQEPAPQPLFQTQDARTGTSGYYSNSTSVATKTNTPLLDIPQSVNVITQQQIKDQNLQGVTDFTRYVPGVAVHQGEGNRDELVIRGVDSSANFFVNGIRDDVQYFRDLYNAQSVEIIKGPSALTFGRGAGGGLLNRTLKEADGQRIYEATAQTGSFADRRISLDAGQAVNENVAVRFNAFYEGTDTFRDFGKIERYGINPTVTLRPSDDTKIKLSYEYYHDERTNDRGNPSQALANVPGGGNRFNPASPFAPHNDLTAFFGSPTYNRAYADVQTTMAIIDHDFGNGLTVRNASLYADYNRGYQNIYPGSSVDPTQTNFNRSAYNNVTDRENAINQTDFTYKTTTGPIGHTLGFGTEFGRQTGISVRNSGFFPNGVGGLSPTIGANPFDPTYFGPVTFQHIATDGNSKYRLYTESGYVRDTIDVTRWLQLIGGVRYDRFDLSTVDRNLGIQRNRVDEKLSPQAAIIVKPVDNVSVYAMYSTSYLPASGDQFSALSPTTLIFEPQKFETEEVGVKWNINPKLLFTAAVYNIDRTNVPIQDPNNPALSFPNGKQKIQGFETQLQGYINPDWQSSIGYAYTDARIVDRVSAIILPGNRVQLVPYNQFSWWNKYQIDSMWAVGGGMVYFTDSFAASDDAVRLPGFVRFDAAVYVKINETWRAQLNIENLFDRGYWATADGNNNLSPGAPRTFRVSATAKF